MFYSVRLFVVSVPYREAVSHLDTVHLVTKMMCVDKFTAVYIQVVLVFDRLA